MQNDDGEKENMNSRTDKTVILAVSFGTSWNDSREAAIGAIEKAIAGRFPEYELREAFSSRMIIEKLKKRDGLEIDYVEEALERAVSDGISRLIVQPTHLMDGYEYLDLKNALEDYKDKFEQAVLGEPLLMSDADFEAVTKVITERTAEYDDGETAVCFMGHGTEADSNRIYAKMQDQLIQAGYENYYIGTVQAEPSIEDVMEKMREHGGYKKAVLKPLMTVAGEHANNDMAGEKENSWKSILEKEGYEVTCILEGLGQIPAIQDIYVSHVQAAADILYPRAQ